jgi:hypothetical protein
LLIESKNSQGKETIWKPMGHPGTAAGAAVDVAGFKVAKSAVSPPSNPPLKSNSQKAVRVSGDMVS